MMPREYRTCWKNRRSASTIPGQSWRDQRAGNGDDCGVGDHASLAARGPVADPCSPGFGLDRERLPSGADREPVGERAGQEPGPSLEALETEAARQKADRQQREGPRELLGIAVEGGGEGGCEQVLEGLLADHTPQVAGHVFAVDSGRLLGAQGIEALAVSSDLEKQPRKPRLGPAREQVRAQELPQRIVVAGAELPVAEDRVAGAADVPGPGSQAEGASDLVEVPVSAGDELGAAVDHVGAAALAAHAPARHLLGLQHLDVVARLL